MSRPFARRSSALNHKGLRMPKPHYEVLNTRGTAWLGEGPWWDPVSARLWWVDIMGRRIRNTSLDGAEGEPIDTASEVGFAVPDDAGGLVAGLRDGLFRRSPDGEWTRLWAADYD